MREKQSSTESMETKLMGKKKRKNQDNMKKEESSDDEYELRKLVIKNGHGKVLDLSYLPKSYLIQKKKEMDEEEEKNRQKKGNLKPSDILNTYCEA